MTTTTKFNDCSDTVDSRGSHFEAQRGKWGLFTELDFVKITPAMRLDVPLIRVNTAI